jgi:hypothetical protein
MRKPIINRAILFAVTFLVPQIVQAQGSVTFLSNLGQPTTASGSVGSDSWLAAAFQTGPNASGYVLNSIQLGMADATGSPNGFTVFICANGSLGGFSPGSSLGSLNSSSDPLIAGNYTYTSGPTLALSPSTVYFIVLTSGTAIANGAYEWSDAAANNYNPSGGWFSLGGGWTSVNGTSWNGSTAAFSQFAINATPAPEPGIIGLFALGGLLVAFQRRKATSV